MKGNLTNTACLCFQVVAAPTGSGKTVILELAILRMLSQCIDEHGQYHFRKKLLRAIYLAPNKALVQVEVLYAACIPPK